MSGAPLNRTVVSPASRAFTVISLFLIVGLLGSCCRCSVTVSVPKRRGVAKSSRRAPEENKTKTQTDAPGIAGNLDSGTAPGGRLRTTSPEGILQRQNPLLVTPHMQEGYRTCWAACAEMVMEFLTGGRVRQCEQASVAFGISSCCVTDELLEAARACDKQWHPEFLKWGFNFDLIPNDSHPLKHLSWEELVTEINEGRPFLFGWVESPPITHMVVGVGYHVVDGDRKVFYLDPLADPENEPIMISFSNYDGSSGVHPHKFDYFRIQPIEPP